MRKSNIARTLIKSGIALLAAMFVLGITACPTDDTGGKTTASSNAQLQEVKFAGLAATLGTPNANYNSVVAGSIIVLDGQNVAVVATAQDKGATIEYALHAAGETLDLTTFFWDPTFTYEEPGDALAIKVTAADKKTILYYKIVVTVADVALDTLSVGDINFTGSGNNPAIPNPAASWDTAIHVGILFSYPVDQQDAAGLQVTATPEKTDSTITYGHAVGDGTPTFTATSKIVFLNGEFLYIKVTNAAETSSAYYKVQVNFQMSGEIKYGSPLIKADTEQYIDPLWNDPALEVYSIEKIYTGDSSGYGDGSAFGAATGKAKAYWDESGLYLYVVVTDSKVSEEEGASGSTAHERDSVELFINEGYPGLDYQGANGGGSQYRVGANGGRSGEGSSPDAFEELGKTKTVSSAWKTDTGYIVIFNVPWRLRSKFPFANPYDNQRKIGFEIQINDAAETGNRGGVIVWNNVGHGNYQNATDYGVAQLIGAPTTLNFPAAAPMITTQPTGGTYPAGDSVSVTVVAEMATGNASNGFTYEWYSASSANAAGVKIDSAADSATYTTTAPAEEGASVYYYVVVTNTVTNTLGTTTASVTSNRARVAAATSAPMIEQLTLAETYAIYKFTLPDGEEFQNYTSIKVDYWMDTENFAVSTRSVRLMGDYSQSLSKFTEQTNGNQLYNFEASNARYIFDDIGAGAITTAGGAASKWFTLTYRLVDGSPNGDFNKDFDDDSKPLALPEDDAEGPFYFGIGIPGGAAGNATAMPKAQVVKNITMVHATVPANNVTGETTNMYVGTAGDKFEASGREMVPDPSFTGDTDFELTFGADEGKGAVVTGQYSSLLKVDLGADFDVTKYAKFSFDFDIYDAADVKVGTDKTWSSGGLQMKWRDTTSTICAQIDEYTADPPPTSPNTWGFDLQNFGPTGSTAAVTARTIPGYLLVESFDNTQASALGFNAGGIEAGTYTVSPLRYLDFETASSTNWNDKVGASGGYIKINKITFHLPE